MKKALTVILSLLLLLSGCGVSVVEHTTPKETLATQAHWVEPIVEIPQETEATKATYGCITGYTLCSADGLISSDTPGACQVYTGGIMELLCELSSIGLRDDGVAVYLFVDGRLQPYRISEDGETAYVHTIYPLKGRMTVPMYFTPITGEEGDCLSLSLWLRPYPNYIQGQSCIGSVYQTHHLDTLLKYEATPPVEALPPAECTLAEWSVSYEALTPADTRGKSEMDLQSEIYSSGRINGDPSPYMIYNVQEGDIINLRYEIYGCPYGEFSLMFFLNGQPVSVAEEDWMCFPVKDGQKTVIEAKIRITGFDSFGAIYGFCICRNFRTEPLAAYCWTDCSGLYFLTAASNGDEHLRMLAMKAGE